MRSLRLALVALAALAGEQPIAALSEILAPSDISRALAIGNAPDAQRARFHEPYVIPVKDVVFEGLEVITEFRRFVLAAEEQRALGNWMLAHGGTDTKGRTLRDILKPHYGRVTIRARLRFHPQNAYTVLPPLEIVADDPPLIALEIVRTPILSASDGQLAAGAIVGATIDGTFNAPSIGDRIIPVRVSFDGRELPRQYVDFSRLE